MGVESGLPLRRRLKDGRLQGGLGAYVKTLWGGDRGQPETRVEKH